MKHSERLQLAQELCAKLVDRYAGEILLGGLYGSTSNGNDSPWSDLEMCFVVADTCPAQGRHLIVKGTAVGYRVYRQSELEEIISNPSLKWPFHMGLLSVLKVLYGDPTQVQAWLALGQSIPPERFYQALEALLPELVVESHGRIHTSLHNQDHAALLPAVLEVLSEMNTALCLLNRRWVTHDYYQGLVDAFSFPKLPEGYPELVPALYNARQPERIVALADALVERFWRLIESQGIRVKNYRTVADVPV